MFAALREPAIDHYIASEQPMSVDALATRYRKLETRRSPDGVQQWLNWAIQVTAEEPFAAVIEVTIFEDDEASLASC
jgi:[ribosomal protein S5]-alanine N-acetyltransferase